MSTSMGGFTNSPVTADNSFAINSKIMIVAVVVLFGVVMFILGLHIYAKWFWRHGGQNGSGGVGWRRRRRLEFAADWPGHERTTQVGLEKSVLDQLPTFTFIEKAGVNQGGPALECAVCLEEFAEGEKGRLLPKCSHSFHIECIDMWFHSHSTCPLCRCSVSTTGDESNSNTQQHTPPSVSISNDGVLLHVQSGDVVIRVSDAGVSGDYNFDQERAPAASSATVAVVEHRPEFPQSDSAAGLASSPRQLLQGSRPSSPSGRRSSTGFSSKPTGIQFPANVLFWGNQAQMNAAGAVVSAGPRDENAGRRRLSSGVHAPNSLVIEIPRPQPLDSSSVFPAQNDTSGDEPHRASDAQGRGPRSPIGRLISSSFRRLLSIRSPGPEGSCSNVDFEQQQQGSSGGATSFQVSS